VVQARATRQPTTIGSSKAFRISTSTATRMSEWLASTLLTPTITQVM
jgi:hypothetical protein